MKDWYYLVALFALVIVSALCLGYLAGLSAALKP